MGPQKVSSDSQGYRPQRSPSIGSDLPTLSDQGGGEVPLVHIFQTHGIVTFYGIREGSKAVSNRH